MLETSTKNKRIAVNSVLLYIRMIVVMAVNLYTVRIVLKALGMEDYGIYNVVAGVITMLASFSSVLASATQRFYSYTLGEKKTDKLQKIFSASTNIYILISLLVIIIGESIGLWFVNYQLVIPIERLIAANWIYQFSIFSFIFSMLSIPFSAASIAHEDMGIFAIISFVEAILRLLFAFSISFVSVDKLIFYGGTLLVIQVLIFFSYFIICRTRYFECRYIKNSNWKIHKEILSFSGWTLFSSFAVVGMNQVITILLNVFFGPLVNAARAIAIQVNSALSTFCNSFIMAIRPPMIKAYAEGNKDYLNKVFLISNKFTYYCMLIIAVPLIFEMDTIISIWLGKVNVQTIRFCQWMVVYGVILSLCNPISIIVQATGKMRQYTLPVEMVTLLTPIVVYLLFKLGFCAESSFVAMVVMVTIAHIVRLFCLKSIYDSFSILGYLLNFCIPAIGVTAIVSIVCYGIHMNITNNYLIRLFTICLSSFVLVLVTTYSIGISNNERIIIKRFIHLNK